MAREYRVKAYFHGSVYLDRSFRRKVVNTLTEAEQLLKDATYYYHSCTAYEKYLDKVVIESRTVSNWEEL